MWVGVGGQAGVGVEYEFEGEGFRGTRGSEGRFHDRVVVAVEAKVGIGVRDEVEVDTAVWGWGQRGEFGCTFGLVRFRERPHF